MVPIKDICIILKSSATSKSGNNIKKIKVNQASSKVIIKHLPCECHLANAIFFQLKGCAMQILFTRLVVDKPDILRFFQSEYANDKSHFNIFGMQNI